MMILEMTAYYAKLGMTLSDALDRLYDTYGYYTERMIDIYMEGLDGIEKRRRVMGTLRDNPPVEIGGVKVKLIGDYKASTVTRVADGSVASTEQPSSDVLYYTLENDDKIIVRPSGTEPKIKIYVLAHGESKDTLDAKAEKYEKDSRKMTEV